MRMFQRCYLALATVALALPATPRAISFSQNQTSVAAYAFVEVEMRVTAPDATNLFTDVTVEADFGRGAPRLMIDGLRDSADGSVYHVRRFVPSRGLAWHYRVSNYGMAGRQRQLSPGAADRYRKGLS